MIDVMAPRQSVNDESVIVVKVWVKSGDVVEEGQAIVEVETSKVNIEVASPADGVLIPRIDDRPGGRGELAIIFSRSDEA